MKMKDDLISRQDAIKALEELIRAREDWISDSYGERQGIDASICAIVDLPSAKRKKGKWTPHHLEEGNAFAVYTCSECGAFVGLNFSNYCPNCGAEMEVGE